MRIILCPECGHDGPYYVIEITDDYVTVRCPLCEVEQGLCAASDMEK